MKLVEKAKVERSAVVISNLHEKSDRIFKVISRDTVRDPDAAEFSDHSPELLAEALVADRFDALGKLPLETQPALGGQDLRLAVLELGCDEALGVGDGGPSFVLRRYLVRFAARHLDEKAKDLVKMGVAKAALLEEGQEIRLPVKTDCLIIGGGIAGMNAALSVADQGFNAFIVEKEPELGGLLNQVCFISHDNHRRPAAKVVQAKVEQVRSHPHINVFTGTQVETVDGYIGNYKVVLKSNGDESRQHLDISTIIVSTGMQEIEPQGLFEYGNDPRVITQLQLDNRLRNKQLGDVKDVVMISCVNSKNETRGCCNIGCHISVKNAIALKHLCRDASVHILYRDMSMIKEEGTAQQLAKRLGVKFLRFPDDRYPQVRKAGDDLTVKVYDLLVGKEFELSSDLIVLATAFKGNDSVEHIKGLLKVSSNPDEFFQESHVKLGPLEFATEGVSLAGCAKAPMTFKESSEAGIGAAMKASIPMQKGFIETEGIVADIDLTDCSQCGLCAKRCPYGAIKVDEAENPEVIKAYLGEVEDLYVSRR